MDKCTDQTVAPCYHGCALSIAAVVIVFALLFSTACCLDRRSFCNDGSHDFVGERVALECDESSKYFGRIHACVPLTIASSPLFTTAFSEIKYCKGNRVIRTTEELESLRYCDYIRGGGLTIEVHDAAADFYAMNDIDTIEGSCVTMGSEIRNVIPCRAASDTKQQH